MKHFLFLIALTSSIALFGNSTIQKIGESITIENLNQEAIDQLESYTLLTNAQGGGTYFLDETNVFLIDYHFLTKQQHDAVWFILNSGTLKFKSLQPFLLKGIQKGEHDIEIVLLANGKQNNSAKIGLHLIEKAPLIKNDAVVLGLLILGLIFYSETLSGFKGFYKYVPALLLCYFIPAIFNSLNRVR